MEINTYEPQKIISLTMRNNINLLPLTENYVKGLVEGIGMSKEKVETIVLLTENILKRRIINAYQGIGDITLDILVGIDRILIEISDKGMPYWVDIKTELEPMPRAADQYQLKKLGTEGQCFSMCFYLDPEIDIMDYKKQDDVEELLQDSNLNIRSVHSDDREINEVIKCIYSNYGYGYLNHRIYDPEQMKVILAEGKQKSYLGVNDHEQVMVHASLAFHDDFPDMPELGGLVCKPFCRGHNMANRIVDAVCEKAQNDGINGIFAMPVAFHPISQKILNKGDFTPTGALLHYVTPESAGAYVDGDRRLDVCICAKLLHGGETKVLNVPQEHQDFVKEIYEKLGCGCEFITGQEPAGAGDFSMRYDSEIGVGQLMVDASAQDFEKDLDAMMKDFMKNNIDMVEAYINISDPSAEHVYRQLEQRGFFFTGILPGSSRGEYMILQNLMGTQVEWEKIVTIEGYREILEYIRANVSR